MSSIRAPFTITARPAEDGEPSLDLSVVLGSGTGALSGLRGTGTIEHTEAGAHLDLDYEL